MAHLARLFVPLALTATMAVGAVPSAQAAPAAVGDVQMMGVAGGSQVWHTIRYADGNWQVPWGVLPNTVYATMLSTVMIDNVEHAVWRTQSGHPYQYSYVHIIRYGNGTWEYADLPYDPVDGGLTDAQAVADIGGRLAIVRKQGNTLRLAVSRGDGTWNDWETVPTTGDIGSFAVSGNGSALRLAVSTADGVQVGVYDRSAQGTWSAPNWTPFNGGTATQVAITEVGSDLQVAAVAQNGASASIWHSILHSNGHWDQFGYVEGAAGTVPGVVSVAMTASRGTMQLAVYTGAFGIYHTIRYSNGTWQRFGEVPDSEGIANVSIAGE
ncbi:hypothetical protein [Kutzneria sp. 744]|uniref:hypothetical protein n=1 Tax=Kutzneria sp. (strain 744) TaxID=345341 RepID=UPI0003EEC22C|nr:hypothetical protein [Kutzneria sp. 744]EWM13919.1 LigA protein [Kutzneria sp. 744]